MLKKATLLVSITMLLATALCLVAFCYLEHFDKEKILTELALALFPVFFSVLLINVLVEKAFEREKKRAEAQLMEKEKKEWSVIHLYLAEKILQTSIDSCKTLSVLYTFLLEEDMTLPISEIRQYDFMRSFTRFDDDRAIYSSYFSRFLGRLEKEHFERYKTFETSFNDVERPDKLIWGTLAVNLESSASARKSAIQMYFDNVGRIQKLTNYYLHQVYADKIEHMLAEINTVEINDYDLRSGAIGKVFGFLNTQLYSNHEDQFAADFSKKVQQALFFIRLFEKYEDYLYGKGVKKNRVSSAE